MYKKRRSLGLQRVSFQALTSNKFRTESKLETQRIKAGLLQTSPLLNDMFKSSMPSKNVEGTCR